MKIRPFQREKLPKRLEYPMALPTTASRPSSGFVKLKLHAIKPANYIYELTPRGIRTKAALTVSFLERKRHEYELESGNRASGK